MMAKRLRFALAAAYASIVGCSTFSGKETGKRLAEFDGRSLVSRKAKLSLAGSIANNGIVLLENDGALPLKRGERVALLGFTGYFCHRMGWGSGDMLDHDPVEYDEGLERAGVHLDPGFAALYREERARRVKSGVYDRLNRDWGRWTARFEEPSVDEEEFAELAEKASRKTKCIVAIGRNAGESADMFDGPGSYRLAKDEELLVKRACENFDTVIVLLNTAGVIDTSFMDRYPVKALVHTSLLGEVSGDAVASILTGKVNPSGKTVDTWARHYYDYPSTDCFGGFEVRYSEGSRVGYRHFDDREIVPRYPFGHGLSYTSFDIRPGTSNVKGTRVAVQVDVANKGSVPGREVVQLYLSRERRDRQAEPVKQLCAFKKTRIIRPGETVRLSLSFDMADCAIYDETAECWLLLGGRYRVLAGNSSANLKTAATFALEETLVAKTVNRFGDTAPSPFRRRELSDGAAGGFLTMADVVAGNATVEQLAAQLSDEDLAVLLNGRALADGGRSGAGGFAAGRVQGEAGELPELVERGVPSLVCADGPSGVRLASFDVPREAYNPVAKRPVMWPCATVVAQGWDERAAEFLGRMVADDMAAAGVDIWLAPAVNVHRNPLCGRNFEYFSEDPLLCGLIGAAIVRGVQRLADGSPSGRFATIKHFCTNNQERNRRDETNIVSEKALREIYLKPFQIAVRDGRPRAVMTSYNRLNGGYCSENYQLLTGVLRDEWGFDGLVMTDWWCSADKLLHPAAGNDLAMPGTMSDIAALERAIRQGKVSRADAQAAAVNVLNAVKASLSTARR